MSVKKIISGILIAAICAGSVCGISKLVNKTTSSGTAIVVSAESLDYSWMKSDSENAIDGYPASEAIQNVVVSKDSGIDSIPVHEGQEVKKGDTLVLFDTEQSRIAMQKKMLDMEQIELNLQVARQNLKTLQNTSPTYAYASGGAADNTTAVYPEETVQQESESVTEITPYDVLSAGSAVAFNESDGIPFADMGKQAYPYKYFVYGDREVKLEASFLQELKADAQNVGKPSLFIQLEAHEKNIFSNLIQHNGTSYILFDVLTLKPLDKDWYVNFSSAVPELYQKEESNSAEQETVTPSPEQPSEQVPDVPSQDAEEDFNAETEDTNTIQDIENLFREEQEQALPQEDSAVSAQGETVSLRQNSAAYGYGAFRIHKFANKIRLPKGILLSEESNDTGASDSGGSYIKPGTAYTKKELENAIKAAEEAVHTLELDKRDCALQIRKLQKEIIDGCITAKLDGVVQNVAAEIPEDGSPIMQVMSAGKIFVEGEISEDMLKNIKEGDHVTVTSWQTGMIYDAEIATISEYPSKEYFSGSYSYDMSASSYKITAALTDEYAYLQTNEFLQINLPKAKNSEENDTESPLYLYRAFILNEDGKFYVYKRGEDNLLHKQEIQTGDTAGDGTEITEGVTRQDYLAFPYDKNSKEGAETTEGSLEDLYES